ncbi:tape measure protein [Geomonas propionica]|uniref:Tape measure protein n=1 Tax=Geomonas propionica TaxID=2798582 RepID=A0ABS0YL06_9BACT|nr:tape measure protein [Geomonas propionica]MBJ6798627.1 tape measure protein [Geomonas propionica]
MTAENTITLRIAAEDAFSATMEKAVQAFALLGKEALADLANIQGAFQTLNLKSALNIETEKAKMLDAFNQIKTSGVASADDIKRAQVAYHKELDNLDQQLKVVRHSAEEADAGHKKLGGTFGSLKDVLGGLFASFGALSFADLVRQSVDASMKVQSLSATLKASTGSAEEAGYAFKFVAAESNRLSLDVKTSADSFSQLAVATRNTSMEGEAARRMFTGFSEMFAGLKLSADRTSGAWTQITQSINKGKVELEDVKIIAEAGVPIFEMLAESMGKTRPEIMQMISNGELLANEVWPKVAEVGRKAFGAEAAEAAKGTAGEMARLKNEVFLNAAAFGKDLGPAVNVVLSVLGGMIEYVSYLVNLYKAGTSAVFGFAFALVEVGKAILSGSIFSAEGRARLSANLAGIKQTFIETLDGLVGSNQHFYKTDRELADEKARNDARRQKESEDALNANKKAQEDYIKTIANEETRLTAKYKEEYEEKKKIITTHFANQLKTVKEGSVEWVKLKQQEKVELEQLELEKMASSALVANKIKETALQVANTQMQAEIAMIENKIAQRLISEQQGASQILALQKAQASEELKAAEQRVNALTVAGLKGTEEYKKALAAQIAAQKESNKLIVQENKLAEETKAKEYAKTATEYKNVRDRELLDIQKYCANGTVSVKEAAVLRLAAETDYLEKVKTIRAQQLADINPQTQALEYQKALATKTEADRQYETSYNQLLIARGNLVKENEAAITDLHRAELEKRNKADHESLQQQRAYAASWFALWDNAYNNGAASLKQLSNAAYNAFAGMNKLPLVLEDSIKSVAAAAKQAEKEAFEMGKAAEQAGMLSGAVWGPTIKNLQMISVNAKQVEADFLKQKVSAMTLGEAMEKLTGATPGTIRAAEEAIRNFKLLDNATLDKVKGQIERLKGIVESFRDAIKYTVASLQGELDDLTLSKSALETKHYEQQIQDLNQKLRQAVELNDQQSADSLNKAIANAKTIHEIKMKNLAEEAAAAKNTDSATTDSGAGRKVGFNRGGRFPGNSLYDTLQVWARPGEWFVQNEAADFWGDSFMAAVNEPWTQAGQEIQQRLAGFNAPVMPDIPMPGVAFSTGGRVSVPEPAEKSTTRIELVAPSGQVAAGEFSKRDARAMLDILQEVGLRTT